MRPLLQHSSDTAATAAGLARVCPTFVAEQIHILASQLGIGLADLTKLLALAVNGCDHPKQLLGHLLHLSLLHSTTFGAYIV